MWYWRGLFYSAYMCGSDKVRDLIGAAAKTASGKKIIALLLALLFTLPTLLTSCGDRGYYEINNSFFIKNRDICILCRRQFITRAADTPVYNRPVGRVTDILDAGEVLTVEYYCTDKKGEVWGITADGGWLSMNALDLVYDNIAFFEQHSGEISDYSDNTLPDGQRYLWTYPCSGRISGADNSATEEIRLTSVFTDRVGRRWVYFEKSSAESGWICLDAPDDDGIEPVDYGPAYVKFTKPIKPPGAWDRLPPHTPYAIAGIVLIVCFEIFMFIRNRRRANKVEKTAKI